MSALFRRSDELAETATSFAQRSLTSAVTQALEEAELERARRARRRGRYATLGGMLVGAAVGYALRGSDVDVEEVAEVGEDAVEVVSEAAEGTDVEVPAAVARRQRSTPTRRARLRSAAPKLLAVGAAAAGLYMLRRRSGGAREMVEQATQRPGQLGEEREGPSTGAETSTREESPVATERAGEPAGRAGGEGDSSFETDESEEPTTTIGEDVEEGEETEGSTDESEDEEF